MKIFNKVEKQEEVYVQYDDLLVLYNSGVYVPASIYDKVFTNDFVVDDNNRFDFVKFTDKDAIEFFKYVDWIINYDDLNKMNPYELNRYYLNTINESNNILRNKKMSFDDIEYEQELLYYKAYSIKTFYLAKYGNLEIDFPTVPWNVLIDDSKNSGLIVSRGIDPNTLLLHKSNKNPFLGTDNVNNKLINDGIAKAIDSDKEHEQGMFEYTTKYAISDDYKYLVIKYRKPKYKYSKYDIGYLFDDNYKCIYNKKMNHKLNKRND